MRAAAEYRKSVRGDGESAFAARGVTYAERHGRSVTVSASRCGEASGSRRYDAARVPAYCGRDRSTESRAMGDGLQGTAGGAGARMARHILKRTRQDGEGTSIGGLGAGQPGGVAAGRVSRLRKSGRARSAGCVKGRDADFSSKAPNLTRPNDGTKRRA